MSKLITTSHYLKCQKNVFIGCDNDFYKLECCNSLHSTNCYKKRRQVSVSVLRYIPVLSCTTTGFYYCLSMATSWTLNASVFTIISHTWNKTEHCCSKQKTSSPGKNGTSRLKSQWSYSLKSTSLARDALSIYNCIAFI